jgi:hypothetical protein
VAFVPIYPISLKLIETDTCVGEFCVSTKLPVVQDPEVVDRVQVGKPVGAIILSKSQVAVPPVVRLAVLKAIIGNVVPTSVIVPVVPKIGSPPETNTAVVLLHVVILPENAIQGGLVLTDTNLPDTFDRFSTPVPLVTIGLPNTAAGPMVITATVKAARADFRARQCDASLNFLDIIRNILLLD